MPRFIILLITVLWYSLSADGQENFSPLSFRGELGGGISLNNPGFSQLPTLQNCCPEFSPTLGMSLGVGVGFEYITGLQLFSKPLRIGAMAGYQLTNVVLRSNEQVGNIIDGENVTDGTVEHSLDVTYGLVGIEPFIVIPLPMERLYFSAGMLVGIGATTEVGQKQTLSQPSDPRYTFENGLRVRNEYYGSLPDASAIQSALVFRGEYELVIDGSLFVVPMLRYQYGLSSIMNSAEMKISSLQGGVIFKVRIPKAPPPAPPPLAPPPVKKPEIARKQLTNSIVLTVDGIGPVPDGDTVRIPVVSSLITDSVFNIIPMVFFEKNSTTIVMNNNNNYYMLRAIKELLQTDSTLHITVVGRTAFDEEQVIARQRVSSIITMLAPDQNQVGVRVEHAGPERYPQLDEENRCVYFEIRGSRIPLTHSKSDTTNTVRPFPVIVTNVLTCEAGPCATTTTLLIEGSDEQRGTASDPAVLKFIVNSPALADTRERLLRVESVTTDSLRQSVTANVSVVLIPVVRNSTTRTVTMGFGNKQDSSILLGLFDFDKTTFGYYDAAAADRIRQHVAGGGRIELLPSTDDIGAPEYNRILQRERAHTAISQLGVEIRHVTITYTDTAPLSNTTPDGRVANRCVRVRLIH